MTPTDWIRVCTHLVENAKGNSTNPDYAGEVRFFKSMFPLVTQRMKSSDTSQKGPLFSLSALSFSIAHQLYKDLCGTINVSLGKSTPLFNDFITAYLDSIDRNAQVFTAPYLAAKRAEAWEDKMAEQPKLTASYIVVTMVDSVMYDYKSLLALSQTLSKVNPHTSCIILTSEEPLDEYQAVRAISKDERIDYRALTEELLDPRGIIAELGDS